MRPPSTSTRADFDAVIALPFGPFGIRSSNDAIDELVFLPPGTALQAPTNDTARLAAEALFAWINDTQAAFPLPLVARGTPFQRRVWAEISAIPAGETRSYGELADRLGSAARAVGQACGANPYPLVVPCHRVTSRAGLGGFANASGGWLLEIKRWLLQHEGAV